MNALCFNVTNLRLLIAAQFRIFYLMVCHNRFVISSYFYIFTFYFLLNVYVPFFLFYFFFDETVSCSFYLLISISIQFAAYCLFKYQTLSHCFDSNDSFSSYIFIILLLFSLQIIQSLFFCVCCLHFIRSRYVHNI